MNIRENSKSHKDNLILDSMCLIIEFFTQIFEVLITLIQRFLPIYYIKMWITVGL